MQIEIKIDSNCKTPKVIIMTDSVTEEINSIIKKLSDDHPKVLTGFKDDVATIIEPQDVFRFYAGNGKVYAITDKGEFNLRIRLYEIEEQLCVNDFVRISNSEIINLKKVRNFDLNFAGTICVTMSDGSSTYVSRRYVSKIKKVLGI